MNSECRLIIDAPAGGAWNMAVDEALLQDAAENNTATLRFYTWSEPTLSLGYFQLFEDRRRHPPSRDCVVVRRQTGGGAILHDGELTYSVALPAGHPLVRQAPQLYAAVHDAFIAALQPILAGAARRWKLVRRCGDSSRAATDEPFLCFQRRASGDVLLTGGEAPGDRESGSAAASPSDWKILGSAQRRHRGAVLQHGSLLLQRSPAAPELAGLCDLTGAVVAANSFARALSVRLADVVGMPLVESRLPPALETIAVQVDNVKYRGRGWTNRR